MSKTIVYTFYDATVGTHSNPMIFLNDGQAIRVFSDIINAKEKESDLAKHPEQFALFTLGEWDNQTGIVEQLKTPKLVIQGKQLLTDNNYTISELDSLFEKWSQSKNVVNFNKEQMA